MESIYALAINGSMLYFSGQIDTEIYEKIDSLIKEIDIKDQDHDYKIFCEMLILLAKTKFNTDLKQLTIKHVFRK